jgi:tetratricopeptide (TPR) repeat protein
MESLKGNHRNAVFAGELVVFTGKLSTIGRKEAHALVEQFGGQAAEEVNAKTTILIVGAESGVRESSDRGESEKTHKLKKAERLNLRASARIRILSESEFCKLVGLTPPDTLRQQYYALRDILGMYPQLREDHGRYLQKWGVVLPIVRTRADAYFEFSDLAVFRQAAAGLADGLPFRAVLRNLQAARSGQLTFDFRIDAPAAKILRLGTKRSRPETEIKERLSTARPMTPPNMAEEYFLKGSALDHDRATQEEAASCYRHALEADPYLVAALINLANIHYASDELVEAQALYERAIGLEPDFFEAHFNLGNIYHDLNRYEEAAACYRDALALNPSYPDTHFYLAVTLEKLGCSVDAKPHWRAYQQLAPDGEWVELAREFSE